jgi:F0F1-type ATP synthase assembly protein I
MTQDENRPPQTGFQAIEGMTMIAVAGQVGCVTLLSVLVAVFLGLYLDRLLGTRPLLLILLVLASAPISLLLTYYVAVRATRRNGKIGGKNIDSEEMRGESER